MLPSIPGSVTYVTQELLGIRSIYIKYPNNYTLLLYLYLCKYPVDKIDYPLGFSRSFRYPLIKLDNP
ncbi:protein of unknown function [Nitratireductor aquimarinus]